MDTKSIRWLHLTDLHIGKVSELQEVALTSLIGAIVQQADGKPFDLVILTGDLVYSGSSEEFARLDKLLIQPLRCHPLFVDAHFYAVPGNHDMDCSIGLPVNWQSIGAKRQEVFFNATPDGVRMRNQRAQAFENYSSFIKASKINSVDPLTDVASSQEFEKNGKKITIISLVTAFFSDTETPDSKKAPIPVHPVRSLIQKKSVDSFTLVLGHHPSNWFTDESDQQFYSLLFGENALYLHGHMHSISTLFGGRGLVSLGFGAGYQAGLDSTKISRYRNSFAICELGDELHVKIVSWDNENGTWRPDKNLPVDFSTSSSDLTDGYILKLPSTPLVSQSQPSRSGLALALQANLKIDQCIWLADDDVQRWRELLIKVGKLPNSHESFRLPHKSLPSGHVQFRVTDERFSYLIYAISATGDVLNYDQIQKLNTELDTQSFDYCIVVTLGDLAKEAKTLSTLLSSKKAITVYERHEITNQLTRALSMQHNNALDNVELDKVNLTIVVTNHGLALLIEDKTNNEWFSVLDEQGKLLNESASLVRQICESKPSLNRISYKFNSDLTTAKDSSDKTEIEFDREKYLQLSLEYFNDVKYAPLAAMGIKFKRTSLSDMYVPASADVGGTSKSSQNALRAINELVESLGLSKQQRDQLEAQLQSRHGLDVSAEVGAASQIYQRFNNIVVLGDPGSGKTCFVKHEILEYCTSRPSTNWYSTHLPVYVPLAEAALLIEGNHEILEICSILSSRRGIELPRLEIEKALFQGKIAFFFDGLDEVGFIDKRINLMAEIGSLVKLHAHKGNRFILASRPAAVQPVDIPEIFTYVQLKGLTEQEIRILAAKVMNARLGEKEEDGLEKEENELINRLVNDIHLSPGIGRIARNPLLLTLLVLIYANSGAVSAKRHLIYSQAIKTLVSVRGRDLREQQLSEADLRTRLGALAVGIFTREINEIPSRKEAAKVISPIIAKARSLNLEEANQETDSFIQEVAEATGLVSIHPSQISLSEDLITFMHFSFLEYYTATGFLSKDYSEVLTRLSINPRWKDVVTLMFGILSDQCDVTEQLRILIHDDSKAGSITKYKLLLAIDCASECDVPPEGAQDLLADEIFNVLSNGPAKYSASLRQQLAEKLRPFLQGAGPRIEKALIKGLGDKDQTTVAAFCDLIYRFDDSMELSKELVQAFTACLKLDSPVLQASAIQAIEAKPELRSSEAIKVITKALSGSIAEKHAALKVLCQTPEYISENINAVSRLLDDPNLLIAEIAAHCLLIHAAVKNDINENSHLREKILSKINRTEQDYGFHQYSITLERDALESKLASENPLDKELAIRYIPLIKEDDKYVYRVLSKIMKDANTTPRACASAMDSFRLCQGAHALITISDTDYICSRLDAKEGNVRIAAIRLLGELPDDEKVIRCLRNILEDSTSKKYKRDEVSEAAKALTKHVRRNPNLRAVVQEAVLNYIPDSVEQGFGDEDQQHHILQILSVCEAVAEVDEKAAQKVLRFSTDYRTPEKIRSQSIRTYGNLTEPSANSANNLIELLDKNDIRIKEAVFHSCLSFIKRCRTKVKYIREVNGRLDALSESLCKAWDREIRANPNSITPSGATDIREGIIEIENLTAAYEEFSERAQLR